tara:strand:- start:977 stop:1309 length:333 start_codon:yes stop_codon:yes gene_type:complete
MAYEIPQKLQYEEKIVVGLTLKQLVYATVFLLPTVLIVKGSSHLYVKLILSTTLLILAFLFIFCDFQKHLINFYFWLEFRQASISSPNMKLFLGVKKIEKGIIIVRKIKT